MDPSTDFYFTIINKGTAEFKDRGSKFIALAYPIKNKDEFKLAMQEVKNLHPKASHFCFAYKIGLDNNNFRSSDAGEPNGSAGKPILNAIDSKKYYRCFNYCSKIFWRKFIRCSWTNTCL